ncbi:unnamed protein product [Arctogadus glacialis]
MVVSCSAPTVTDVNRLFCVGLRGLSNPDIVATDVDPPATGTHAERIVLPDASTERVWSWELQVDGGQEPFSPTGTDGGDGGSRLEVRGGRLEVLAVRSVAVVWRRTEAEVLEAEASLEEAVAWRSWRQRPAWRRRWPGGPGGRGQPGGGGGLEVLEASNLEGAAWRARWRLLIQRAWRRPTWKAWRRPRSWRQRRAWRRRPTWRSWSRVGLEAAAAAILEADYLEVLEADCGDHPGGPGGGVHMAAAALEGLEAVANLEGLEAVANLEGLEATAGLESVCLEAANLEVLEAAILESLEAPAAAILEETAGLEVANLVDLEAAVGTNLEVPAVASTWRRSAWRARRSAWRARRSAWRARRASWRARRRRPGGPGGGVLEGPAVEASWRARRWRRPGGPGGGVLEGPAVVASWRARRWRRPGGPGGGGVLEGPAVAASWRARRPVGPVEVLEETVPAVEDGWGIRRWRSEGGPRLDYQSGLKESLGMKITAQGLTTPPPPSSFWRSVLMVQAVKPPSL